MYEGIWFASQVIIAVGIIGVCAFGAIAVTKLVLRAKETIEEKI